MEKLLSLYKKNKQIDSPWIIIATADSTKDKLEELSENILGAYISNSPDYFYKKYPQFGIEDARDIKRLQSKKSFNYKRVFFIHTSKITHEAQNALLKILEEPNYGTVFFLMIPNINILLPTLLSRVQIAYGSHNIDNLVHQPDSFLSAAQVKRLNMAKDIIDKKDRESAIEFINSIEHYIYKKWIEKNKDKIFFDSLNELSYAREFLHKRGTNIKYILEHISLVLQQF